jgi:hypothetical protein
MSQPYGPPRPVTGMIALPFYPRITLCLFILEIRNMVAATIIIIRDIFKGLLVMNSDIIR